MDKWRQLTLRTWCMAAQREAFLIHGLHGRIRRHTTNLWGFGQSLARALHQRREKRIVRSNGLVISVVSMTAY